MALVLHRAQCGAKRARRPASRFPPPLPPRLRVPVGWVLLVVAVACSGCFDYEEEIWLYPNQSGRVECKLRVPAEVWALTESVEYAQWRRLEQRLGDLAARVDGAELTAFHETSTRRNYRADWAFDFDSAETLQTLLREGAALALSSVPDADVWGRPRATVEQLGRLTNLTRSFPPLPPPRLDGQDAGVEFRFAVHTPYPILTAKGAVTEEQNHVARWTIAPGQFIRDGLDMRVSYRRPFPLGPFLGGAGVFAIGILAIWGFALLHMTRGLRRARAAASVTAPPAPGEEPAFGEADSSEFVDDWTEP